MKDFYKKKPYPDDAKRHSKNLQILKYKSSPDTNKVVNFELFAAQNIHIVPAFKKLFSFLASQNRPIRIVEVGTFKGGLTVILDTFSKLYSLDYELHTYDINSDLVSKETKELFKELGVIVHVKDVFEAEGKEVKTLIEDTNDLAVLFCDGGNKSKEINDFSKFLKAGDIVLGHDYGFDKEAFSSKDWNAHELDFKKVSRAYNSENLKFIFKDIMEEAVWFCARKTNIVGQSLQILTVCNEPYTKIMIHLIKSLELYHPEVPVKMLALNLSDESKQLLLNEHSNLMFIDDSYEAFENFEEERAYCESCRTWNIKRLLSESCMDVFYLDGDVYLEDNLYDLFDFFEPVDFCARVKVENPLRFNAGMIYVKNTDINTAIIAEWEQETRKHGWVWLSAQNELGNVLEQHKEKVVIKTLPVRFDGIDTNPETVIVHMKGPIKRKR